MFSSFKPGSKDPDHEEWVSIRIRVQESWDSKHLLLGFSLGLQIGPCLSTDFRNQEYFLGWGEEICWESDATISPPCTLDPDPNRNSKFYSLPMKMAQFLSFFGLGPYSKPVTYP